MLTTVTDDRAIQAPLFGAVDFGGTGDHRVEQQAKQRIVRAGGDRDAEELLKNAPTQDRRFCRKPSSTSTSSASPIAISVKPSTLDQYTARAEGGSTRC